MRIRSACVAAIGAALMLALGSCAGTGTTSSIPQQSSPSVGVDLTSPGAAGRMVAQLIDHAGTDQLIQVEITKQQAAVSVVKNRESETWAFRDGEIKKVDSDIAYVEQGIFTIGRFNISDVGSLFARAAAISGSTNAQQLQIVDYSAGEVMMTVSTVPESRTVFFYPDGSLLPVLNFHTESGIKAGLSDAVGTRRSVLTVGVQSNLGVYIDYPGGAKTIVRRLRTSQVPTTNNPRAESSNLPLFDPGVVQASAIWTLLARAQEDGDFNQRTQWSLVVDDRDRTGDPHMYFTIDGHSVTTDLRGSPLPDR